MQAAWKTLVVAGVIAALSGCSSMGKKTGAGEAGAQTGAGMDDGATQPVDVGSGVYEGISIDDPRSPISQRVIYFEFDSSEVRQADHDTLAHHAKYISQNPGVVVTLEGHGDERGSREYNIGLGERRAQAVRQILELSGVGGNQLSTVSYGEEKPAVDGHDESAWSQNRRVELIYPTR